MIASRGLSNTRWRARVSSTTPRLGDRCPPVWAMCSIRNWRISSASSLSWDWVRRRRSAGDLMSSSKALTLGLTSFGGHQFREVDADPGPRPGRRSRDGRQLALVVPGAGRDVQVDPGLAFHELLDEHAPGD